MWMYVLYVRLRVLLLNILTILLVFSPHDEYRIWTLYKCCDIKMGSDPKLFPYKTCVQTVLLKEEQVEDRLTIDTSGSRHMGFNLGRMGFVNFVHWLSKHHFEIQWSIGFTMALITPVFQVLYHITQFVAFMLLSPVLLTSINTQYPQHQLPPKTPHINYQPVHLTSITTPDINYHPIPQTSITTPSIPDINFHLVPLTSITTQYPWHQLHARKQLRTCPHYIILMSLYVTFP